MRLLLSIPSLETGGAERQFASLAAGLAARGHEVLAVTLGKGGPLTQSLGNARLVELGKRSRLDNLRVAYTLAGLLRSFRPQAHYAFLPTACVLGALLKTFAPGARLVMGLRATSVTHSSYAFGRASRLLLGLEARLSARADLVIANSDAGRTDALRRGFDPARVVVAHNGIDTTRLRPDRALGLELRAEWGAAGDQPLIGLVARLDPVKGHANFLRAAALLAAERPDVRFVCVGGGPEAYAAQLRGLAAGLGLEGRLAWAGERQDMTRVYNALDLLCLASASESFPNVLGEAMSCGAPCVTTDAGDAGLLVGETGAVVPCGDASALAAGLAGLLARLEREGESLRAACRTRVEGHFSMERMVAATEGLLLGLCGEGP